MLAVQPLNSNRIQWVQPIVGASLSVFLHFPSLCRLQDYPRIPPYLLLHYEDEEEDEEMDAERCKDARRVWSISLSFIRASLRPTVTR